MLRVKLHPEKVLGWLVGIVAVLSAASLAAQWFRLHAPPGALRDLAALFKLSAEHTIPAFYSAALLLASAGLLWLVARVAADGDGAAEAPRPRRFLWHWRALAWVFVYLSIDEAVGIHEMAIEPMRRVLGPSATGVLHFAWVVPGCAFVLLLGALYLRFLLHLPRPVRRRIVLAGVTFLAGALGMEMVGGYLAERMGTETVAYALAALIEEVLEMLGTSLFIYALLYYLRDEARQHEHAADAAPSTGAVSRSSPALVVRLA